MTNDPTARTPNFAGSRILLPGAGLLRGLRRVRHSFPPRGIIRHFSLLLPLLLPHVARCQSRLDQLEATYQSNLRALDAPILQDYLRQLDFLKSQLVARNRADDAKQVDAEITRMKSVASTSGIFPITELEGPMATPEPNALKPSAVPAPARNDPSPLPTLLAAEAFNGQGINARTGALPIGNAEWRIFKLPAGTYDVLLVFATESLTLPEQLTLNIGGREFHAVIPVDRATGSPGTFRLLRLCEVTLDADVNGGTLSIAAATSDKPLVWLKKLIFAAPKKPDTPTTK
jgi:hypothetical protein